VLIAPPAPTHPSPSWCSKSVMVKFGLTLSLSNTSTWRARHCVVAWRRPDARQISVTFYRNPNHCAVSNSSRVEGTRAGGPSLPPGRRNLQRPTDFLTFSYKIKFLLVFLFLHVMFQNQHLKINCSSGKNQLFEQ
jgi:hypothetical protein